MAKIGFRPWDVSIDGKSYKVRIEITDRGAEYYDVKEQCNSDAEFVRFDSEMFVCWGIKYEPRNKFAKDIMGNLCVELEDRITITRNGIDFYSFFGDINTGIDQARIIISKLKKHDIKFENRDYESTIIGLVVEYKGKEYTVVKWIPEELKVKIKHNCTNKTKTISIFDESAKWITWRRDPKEEQSCFVYILMNNERSKIKIGISGNPVARAKNIQTSSGEELELINTIEFGNREQAQKAEEFLHKKFSNYRMKHTKVSKSSEWFDAEMLKTMAGKYDTKERIESEMKGMR